MTNLVPITRSAISRRHTVPVTHVPPGHAAHFAQIDVLATPQGSTAQHDDDEIWMISYMDIMTLLLTLFVLLLAYSRIAPEMAPTARSADDAISVAARVTDQATTIIPPAVVQYPVSAIAVPQQLQIADEMQLPDEPAGEAVQFGIKVAALSSVPVDSLTTPAQEAVVAGSAQAIAAESSAPGAEQGVVSPDTEADRATEAEIADEASDADGLQQMQNELLAAIQNNALADRIEVSSKAGSVQLEISDGILFDVGSAALKPVGTGLLDELAGLLTSQHYDLSVEGHTDNQPVSDALYPSNWELSAARATQVTRYLIAQGIDAARLRAIGYADTRPRAGNDTAENRARNRRVSLILSMPAPQQVNSLEMAASPRSSQ